MTKKLTSEPVAVTLPHPSKRPLVLSEALRMVKLKAKAVENSRFVSPEIVVPERAKQLAKRIHAAQCDVARLEKRLSQYKFRSYNGKPIRDYSVEGEMRREFQEQRTKRLEAVERLRVNAVLALVNATPQKAEDFFRMFVAALELI